MTKKLRLVRDLEDVGHVGNVDPRLPRQGRGALLQLVDVQSGDNIELEKTKREWRDSLKIGNGRAIDVLGKNRIEARVLVLRGAYLEDQLIVSLVFQSCRRAFSMFDRRERMLVLEKRTK